MSTAVLRAAAGLLPLVKNDFANYALLPPPEPHDRLLAFENFYAPGFEPVDVVRPALDEHRVKNPDAPALVLIPGLGMDSRNYIRQLPLGALADLHMPQAMNAPVAGEEGLGHFARHVEEFVLDRRLDRRPGGFVIGGSSMGGTVSLNVCLRGRVKPRGLVLIGSFANAKRLPLYQRMLAPLSWILPINLVKRLVKKAASRGNKVAGFTPEELKWLVSTRIQRTNGYYGRAIMALTRQNQLPAARNLKLPALVLHGTDDWVLPHAAGVEMAQTIPGAEFVSVHGAGHGIFFTHAEQVNRAVAGFLRRL
ncbi:MAG TPA: alpha/beta hydrolase [Planctomycetota bacterium]|nr:alpha/beta hydrolase [Planctomycetota bacterium]